MKGIEEAARGIFLIPVILPGSPLKCLNSYVIKGSGGGRNLLVDTGFPFKPCRKSLMEGIEALGLDMKNTDVFLTHLHSDHVGNAGLLKSMGAEIYISEKDLRCWHGGVMGKWDSTFKRTAQEGFPPEYTGEMIKTTAQCLFMDAPEGIHAVQEGYCFSAGDYNFQCIATPGHTPGHMCLYDGDKKLMLCGDHVLFDITPNIVSWPGAEDSLGDYLESLEKLNNYEIELALPGHRSRSDKTIYQRAGEIKAHHLRRLGEIISILSQSPGLCGYEIASRLSWNIRAQDWDSFPLMQKYFAMRETVAHLDYLLCRSELSFELISGLRHYYLNKKD